MKTRNHNQEQVKRNKINRFLFVWVEALRPSQQFFSHVGTFTWVEPVLSNEDEVSCTTPRPYRYSFLYRCPQLNDFHCTLTGHFVFVKEAIASNRVIIGK